MRLSDIEKKALRETADSLCSAVGPARLWLFGSRTDDRKRGGDIDLLLELDVPLDSPRAFARKLRCSLYPKIGERKIDIVIRAANTPPDAFHDLISDHKELLWQSA